MPHTDQQGLISALTGEELSGLDSLLFGMGIRTKDDLAGALQTLAASVQSKTAPANGDGILGASDLGPMRTTPTTPEVPNAAPRLFA